LKNKQHLKLITLISVKAFTLLVFPPGCHLTAFPLHFAPLHSFIRTRPCITAPLTLILTCRTVLKPRPSSISDACSRNGFALSWWRVGWSGTFSTLCTRPFSPILGLYAWLCPMSLLPRHQLSSWLRGACLRSLLLCASLVLLYRPLVN